MPKVKNAPCQMCRAPHPYHTTDCAAVRAMVIAEINRAKEHNGWTNYETWVVNLWIDNEEALADERRERVQAIIRDNVDDGDLDVDAAVGEVSEWLKTWISDEIPETYFEETVNKVLTGALGPYCDLLGAALSEVDWFEIARHDVDNEKDEIMAEIKADAEASAESEA